VIQSVGVPIIDEGAARKIGQSVSIAHHAIADPEPETEDHQNQKDGLGTIESTQSEFPFWVRKIGTIVHQLPAAQRFAAFVRNQRLGELLLASTNDQVIIVVTLE
jgi:hypothetical protein